MPEPSVPLLGTEPAENAQLFANNLAGAVIAAFMVPSRWAGLITMVLGGVAKITTKLVKRYSWLG